MNLASILEWVGAFFVLGEIRAFLCLNLGERRKTMASRIQGITVEIGGDTTKLRTALKGLNGEIKSTQSQLKNEIHN